MYTSASTRRSATGLESDALVLSHLRQPPQSTGKCQPIPSKLIIGLRLHRPLQQLEAAGWIFSQHCGSPRHRNSIMFSLGLC